jgi:hypothetical protein
MSHLFFFLLFFLEMLGFAISHIFAFDPEHFDQIHQSYHDTEDKETKLLDQNLRGQFTEKARNVSRVTYSVLKTMDIGDIGTDVGKYVFMKQKQAGGDLVGKKEMDLHGL